MNWNQSYQSMYSYHLLHAIWKRNNLSGNICNRKMSDKHNHFSNVGGQPMLPQKDWEIWLKILIYGLCMHMSARAYSSKKKKKKEISLIIEHNTMAYMATRQCTSSTFLHSKKYKIVTLNQDVYCDRIFTEHRLVQQIDWTFIADN